MKKPLRKAMYGNVRQVLTILSIKTIHFTNISMGLKNQKIAIF